MALDGRSEPGEPKEIHRRETTRHSHGAELQGVPSPNVTAPSEAIRAVARRWFVRGALFHRLPRRGFDSPERVGASG